MTCTHTIPTFATTCDHAALAHSKDGSVCFACQFQAKYPSLNDAQIGAAAVLAAYRDTKAA